MNYRKGIATFGRKGDMADTSLSGSNAGLFSPEQGKQLAQKGYELLIRVATKASQVALVLFVMASLICVSALITGLLALSGTVRALWLIGGGMITVIGVGAAFRSWRSLTRITEQAAGISESFDRLIETVSNANVFRSLDEAEVESMGVFRQAKLTRTIKRTIKDSIGEFQDLSSAFAAVSTFPSVAITALAAIVISGSLGFIFLVMLLT
ncbi:MAG: hypothetical protein HKN03_05040 [Acidimicrobiales bacterium]|nr:hypothetical protein [Acidimicrobiales bacterium]